MVSVWVPFDHIAEETSVEFIQGSHRLEGGPRAFAPRRFTDDTQFETGLDESMLELPDIPAQRSADGKSVQLLGEERQLLRFTLEPGDCLMCEFLLLPGLLFCLR